MLCYRYSLAQSFLAASELLTNKQVKGDFSAQKYTSSDFELWGTVLNLGSVSSTENAYAVYSEYKWKTGPFNAYTDKLALAWQSQATPYGSPSGTHYWYSSGGTHSFKNSVHQQLVQGDSWNVDVIAGGDQQDGWGRQELRVAKSYQGTTGAVVLGYAHRYAPGSTGVSLSYGIISFSGSLQTEYNDRLNFTY